MTSAYDLWKQAGGGTDRFDRDEYRRLMVEHGLLIPLKPGETAKPLPCGWPNKPSDPDVVAMYDEHMPGLPGWDEAGNCLGCSRPVDTECRCG